MRRLDFGLLYLTFYAMAATAQISPPATAVASFSAAPSAGAPSDAEIRRISSTGSMYKSKALGSWLAS